MKRLKLSFNDWKRLDFDLFLAYEGPPTSWSGIFDSVGIVAWQICAGRVEVESMYGRFNAGKGNWVLHAPARRFQHFSSDARIRSAQFRLRWPSGANVVNGMTPLIIPARSAAGLAPVFSELMKFANRTSGRLELRPDQAVPLEDALGVNSAVFNFLRGVLRIGSARGWEVVDERELDPRVRRVLEILSLHPLDEPLSKQALAAEVRLGPTHLNRLFVSSQGRTPRQIFEERRLESAREELLKAMLSVKEIASLLGFRSLPRFSAWFKGHEGIPPRVFRSRERPPAEPKA